MNFVEFAVEKINNLSKENNFTINDERTLVRCINRETSKMLIAYSKQVKGIKFYIDSLEEIKNNNEISRYTNIISKVNYVSSRNSYYSNQGTVKNIIELDNLINILSFLSSNTELLKSSRVRGCSIQVITATSTRELVSSSSLSLTRNLKFGMELELTVPSRSLLERKLTERGITVVTPSSTHEVVSGWKIVSDSSIRVRTRGYQGCELVSPPSTNFDELKIVCEVLKEIDAKVNSSCGLHIHHDISDLKRRQIMRVYNFYNKYEEVINYSMPANRVDNRYCKPVSTIINKVNSCETKQQLLKEIAGQGSRLYYSNCRYYTLNLRSFLYYGTIEFRQGFATIDFDTISSWILFTHKIIERALEIENDIEYNVESLDINNKFSEMIKELKIDNTSVEKNMKNRFKKYKRRAA